MNLRSIRSLGVARVAALAQLSGLAALPACSSSSSDAAAATAPGPPSTGGTRNAGAVTITFAETEIVLVPGQAQRIALAVAPPAVYSVQLALVGDAADAYLDASEITTDQTGAGSFTLTAPSSKRTFSVRASVGTDSQEIQATPATGYATLDLVPIYSGHRKITTWIGTVSTEGTCDAALVPPPDGPLSAASMDRPQVDAVPIGVPLTVTVRAGHFAGGCVQLSRVVSDSAGAPVTVSVPAVDRPLSTDALDVPLQVDIDTSTEWIAAWTALAEGFAESVAPSTKTDATTLLDAMQDATPASSRPAFIAARALHAWDERLVLSLGGTLGKHGIGAAVVRWLELGTLSKGALAGTLRTADGTPSLSIESVGGLLPADAGFPTSVKDGVSLSTSSDDQIVFGATTPAWQPAKLAAALALAPAKLDFPDAVSVPDALADLVRCPEVAKVLVGSSGEAYSGCDAACIEQRCADALDASWTAAAAAPDTATLQISGSATVTAVADDATPTAIAGTWVGSVQFGDAPTKVGGSVATAAAIAR